jgi:hypothetical protein
MKPYLIAALLIGVSSVPASAATFYFKYNKTTKQCSIALTPPTETEKFSMMGQYGSELAAKEAMSKMKECKR